MAASRSRSRHQRPSSGAAPWQGLVYEYTHSPHPLRDSGPCVVREWRFGRPVPSVGTTFARPNPVGDVTIRRCRYQISVLAPYKAGHLDCRMVCFLRHRGLSPVAPPWRVHSFPFTLNLAATRVQVRQGLATRVFAHSVPVHLYHPHSLTPMLVDLSWCWRGGALK